MNISVSKEDVFREPPIEGFKSSGRRPKHVLPFYKSWVCGIGQCFEPMLEAIGVLQHDRFRDEMYKSGEKDGLIGNENPEDDDDFDDFDEAFYDNSNEKKEFEQLNSMNKAMKVQEDVKSGGVEFEDSNKTAHNSLLTDDEVESLNYYQEVNFNLKENQEREERITRNEEYKKKQEENLAEMEKSTDKGFLINHNQFGSLRNKLETRETSFLENISMRLEAPIEDDEDEIANELDSMIGRKVKREENESNNVEDEEETSAIEPQDGEDGNKDSVEEFKESKAIEAEQQEDEEIEVSRNEDKEIQGQLEEHQKVELKDEEEKDDSKNVIVEKEQNERKEILKNEFDGELEEIDEEDEEYNFEYGVEEDDEDN